MDGFNKLTERCLNKAEIYAKRDNDQEVRVSHVIYSILNDKKKNFVLEILEDLNVDLDILLESISNVKKENIKKEKEKNTPKKSKILQDILKYAKDNFIPLEGKITASIEDIFYAVMYVENELSETFMEFALEPNTYKESVIDLDNDYLTIEDEGIYYEYAEVIHTKDTINSNDILDKYCSNLNKLAIENKVDISYERDNELNQMYRILLRSRKSNPILIGQAGVGKTNIVEGLAYNIVNGLVPNGLLNKTLYVLNLNSVLAGTKYRGMFEERIESILNELAKNKDSILFIDELHTIMGAGSAEGSLDLSNILKPYIARSGFKIIGATTVDEYKKKIEQDKALKRRFAEIHVKEPSISTSINILKKLKYSFEITHNVHYTDDAIVACVELSDRYMKYRCLPDKAIDLLDDVAVKKRLQDIKPSIIQKLQLEYKALEDIKKEIIASKDYDRAETIKQKSNRLLININKEKNNIEQKSINILEITVDDVRILVEEITGIPVANNGFNVIELKKTLQAKITGQNDAIDSIIKTLMVNQFNLGDDSKPIGSFIFIGYSGVGKTQLAKELAKNMFGNEKYLIRLDCSEYSQKHEISKLIGAPAGFIGYEEGGILTDAVKRNPFSVILFDEIEKAHDKLFDIMLQVLGEGRLTDNQGETVDFKNTIIILTSNIGTQKSISNNSKIGFSNNDNIYDKNIIIDSLNKKFKPEFLNRLDNIIHFNALSKDDLMVMLDLELNKLIIQVEKHGVLLKISPAVKTLLVEQSYIPENGFRVLKRKLNDTIKNMVAEELIKKEKDFSEISIIVKNKKISIK